jgi:integrase
MLWRFLFSVYRLLTGNQEVSLVAQGRISKQTVDKLVCPAGKDRHFLWDEDLAGFGVGVFPTGKRVYVAQYRKDGRSRRVTLGEHGRLTPTEARSQAKVILGAVETGVDPVAERRAALAVRTFAEVAEDFLVNHVAAKRKKRTHEEYAALFRAHVFPAIGSKRIVDVRRADVARLHSYLSDKPYQANRALALISVIWNWAARREEVVLANNPAKGIERYPEQGRERFLTTEELERFGAALAEGESIGLPWVVDETNPRAKHIAKLEDRRTKLDPFAAAAIRLLILTGARLREVLNAQWSQIDMERGVIFLADSKTGRKPIYLSAAAREVVASIPRIEGNPYVIAGSKDGQPRADLKKPWAAIKRAARLDGLRLHDLRHSFASFGAGASLGLPIIGKLLGQKQASTTQRYAHLEVDPLHRAADTIGSAISAAMNGERGSAVVPLQQGIGRSGGA